MQDSNRLYCSLQCKHRSVDPQHCKRAPAFVRRRGCGDCLDIHSDESDRDSSSQEPGPKR